MSSPPPRRNKQLYSSSPPGAPGTHSPRTAWWGERPPLRGLPISRRWRFIISELPFFCFLCREHMEVHPDRWLWPPRNLGGGGAKCGGSGPRLCVFRARTVAARWPGKLWSLSLGSSAVWERERRNAGRAGWASGHGGLRALGKWGRLHRAAAEHPG